MLRTTALIIGALTTEVLGAQLLTDKYQGPAQKEKADPCSQAVLNLAKNYDD